MGHFSSGAEGERRVPPPELVAAAAGRPGGWVYEIDTSWVDDPDGYVPPEAIRGGWKVAENGALTGEFEENPRYGPPADDFAALQEPDHWLGWVGEDPGAAVREQIGDILNRQVPGSEVEWLRLLGEPRFLTGGRPEGADHGNVVVTRTGFAVSFALSVRPPEGERSVLTGVFSWVAAGLDQPGGRRDRVWFDLDAEPDWAERELRTRIYELDETL